MRGFVPDSEILHVQRRWLVLFFDPIHRLAGWDIFNTPGFRHCCLLAFLPLAHVWLYLDYARDGTAAITVEAHDGWKLIQRICRNGGTVLAWDAPKDKPKQPLLYPPNCVSFCQQFLGVRKLVWTPYGLALCLSDLGAQPMFGTERPKRGLYGHVWRRRWFGTHHGHAGRSAGQDADPDQARG